MEFSGPIKIHKKKINKREKALAISKTVIESLFILSAIVEMIVKNNKINDVTSFILFSVNYSKKFFIYSVSYLILAAICLLIFKLLGKDKKYNEYFPSSMKKFFFCNAILAIILIIIGSIIL